MITLVGALLTAPGGPWWQMVRQLARTNHIATRTAWLIPVIMATPLFAAAAAGEVSALLNARALLMFQGMALIAAAITMCRPTRAPWRIVERAARSNSGGFIVLTALLVADSALFLVMATAARTNAPWPAAIGAIIGLGVVAMAAREADLGGQSQAWIARLRPIAGIILLMIGIIIVLTAMQLI